MQRKAWVSGKPISCSLSRPPFLPPLLLSPLLPTTKFRTQLGEWNELGEEEGREEDREMDGMEGGEGGEKEDREEEN